MDRTRDPSFVSNVGVVSIVLILAIAALRAGFAPRAIDAGDSRHPPVVHRVMDTGILPYDLAISGRADHLIAVNADERERAVSADVAQFFPALATLPGVRFPIDPEAVMVARPDAIFVSRDWIDSLKGFGFSGLTELTYDPRESAASKVAIWDRLGSLMDENARVASLSSKYLSQRAALATRLHGVQAAGVLILAGGLSSWSVAGEGYYLNDLLTAAKGINIAGSSSNYPQVDLEQLIALDPEMILLNSQPGDKAIPTDLYQDPHWQILRAVRARRIYKLPRFAIYLGPAEEPIFLEWLAAVLHPQLSLAVREDLRAAYREIYAHTLSDEEIDAALNCRFNARSDRSAGCAPSTDNLK